MSKGALTLKKTTNIVRVNGRICFVGNYTFKDNKTVHSLKMTLHLVKKYLSIFINDNNL